MTSISYSKQHSQAGVVAVHSWLAFLVGCSRVEGESTMRNLSATKITAGIKRIVYTFMYCASYLSENTVSQQSEFR